MYSLAKSLLFFFLILVYETVDIYGQDELPPCDLPSNVNIKAITLNSAKINWKNIESVNGWIIRWRTQFDQYDDINISVLIDTNFYTIANLLPNNKYFFQFKSVCEFGESDWSNDYTFITNLTNPSYCSMSLPVKDPSGNNHPEKTYFYIQCDEYTDKKLGEDVFLQNIQLIIDHDWTSDLDIKLTSPSGKSFFLIKSLQVNNQIGFGNPDDPECIDVLSLSDDACLKLSDTETGFTGEFLPKEPVYSVYDSNSPGGIWILEITDKVKNNSGMLRYFNLEFAPILCPIPTNINIIPQNDKTLEVNWQTNEYIDSVVLKIVGNNETRIFKSFSSGNFFVGDLVADTEYSISLQSKCFNYLSAFSCEKNVKTFCNVPGFRETFDNNQVCEDPCLQDCLQSELWFNNYEYNKKWLVNDDETNTENTGPDSDVYGNGKYIYLESSSGQCENDTLAILQSTCIKVNESHDGCDMSFYYNMYGVDISSLSLEISNDGGLTWSPLFFIEGNQGNKWIREVINLQDFSGKICIFRFVGKVRKDRSYGDIAIDDIVFYNSVQPDPSDYTYFPDRDNDGFGKDTSGIFMCLAEHENFVKNNLDCDDDNTDINPDAPEIKCNFIDENCNGMADDAEGEKPLTIQLVKIVDETCMGKNDGSMVVSVADGIPPYNFLWTNGSTDSILINIGKGEYWCQITDQTGCGINAGPYFVNQNSNMNIIASNIKHTICNGINNGEIEIDITGGTEPYTYEWNNGMTTKKIIDLASGFYFVSVIGSDGCLQVSDSFEIKSLASFTSGILQLVQPSCHGTQDGRIELKVTNGNPPYSFHWSNGSEAALNSGLGAGEYYCTITDSDNCFQIFGPVSLLDPEEFIIKITTIDNVTCIGEENGSIEISARGGISPYSFQWSSYDHEDFISFKDDIYNLRSGTYMLNASDLNGCMMLLDSIEIKTIDSIQIEVDSLIDAACSRSEEGYISLNATNGYQNYYYFWNDGNRGSTIDSLSAGSYSVTVTDDLGCKFVLNNIEIKSLDVPIGVQLQLLDEISCFGALEAKIFAVAESINTPFDFNWSAGIKNVNIAPEDSIYLLPAGKYNVTVTDNFGCVGISDDLIIDQPQRIEITDVKVSEILCNGDNSGSIEINLVGGVEPYSISWNEGTYSGNKIIKLIAGSYQASIQDHNGCEYLADTVFLYQPDEIIVKIVTMDAHKDSSDGSAILLVEGGVFPYEIIWDSNANDQIGSQAVNLAKGWYTATITDDNGCIRKIQVFINEIPVGTEELAESQFLIFPNPAKDYFVIEKSDILGEIKNIEFYNVNGIKQHIDLFDFDNAVKVFFNNLPDGLYFLQLDTGQKYFFRKIIILN